MDPEILEKTSARNSSGSLLESAWQGEFYRVATACMPHNRVISFGFENPKTGGIVDFVINGDTRWAFELVRESNRLEQHVKHFSVC